MNLLPALRPRFKVPAAAAHGASVRLVSLLDAAAVTARVAGVAVVTVVALVAIPRTADAQEASILDFAPENRSFGRPLSVPASTRSAAPPSARPTGPGEPAAARPVQGMQSVRAVPQAPQVPSVPSLTNVPSAASATRVPPGGSAPAAVVTPSPSEIIPPGRVRPAAIDQVAFGTLQCEEGHQLAVTLSATHPGHVEVSHRSMVWLMRPVHTDSGAIRLEDVRGQALLVQIPSKTMLLNPQSGQRLLDGCATEAQLRERRAAHPGRSARAVLLQ